MKKSELETRWSDPEYLAGIEEQLTAIFENRSLEYSVDLRGMIVGLDGALKRLEFTSFEHSKISLVDFGNSRVACSFRHAEFKDVSFAESLFDTCNMISANFSRCNFRFAKIYAPILNDAVFDNCVFSEALLKGRGLKEYGGRRTVFQSCNFRDARLKSLEFRASRFVDCQLDGAVFEKCDLRGVKFEGSSIDSSQLIGCDTSGAIIA